MDRARPYLPVLLAMTGSSPFHDGVDTGYDSYRTLWWSRWPNTGPPEYLGSAERFQEVVAGLVASGRDRGPVAPLLGRAALLPPPDAGVPARRRLHRRGRRRPARGARAVAGPGAGRPGRAGRAVPAAAAGAAPGGAVAGRPARHRRAAVRPGAVRAGGRAAGGPPPAGRAGGRPPRAATSGPRSASWWTRLFARGTSAARQRQIWLQTGDRREVAARMVARRRRPAGADRWSRAAVARPGPQEAVVKNPSEIVWFPLSSRTRTSSSYSVPGSRKPSTTASSVRSPGTCTS